MQQQPQISDHHLPKPKPEPVKDFNQITGFGETFQNTQLTMTKQPEVSVTVKKCLHHPVTRRNSSKTIDIPVVSVTKKIKKENLCGHHGLYHYAKNMCYSCYHKFGRTKKPWKCDHALLYARGLCHPCYIELYNRKKQRMGFKRKKQCPIVEIPCIGKHEKQTIANCESLNQPATPEDSEFYFQN
jgi:hypothetical protein